ncbi:hypothetical protein EDC04DRAFT_3144408 [Pisolithus marmoratus]|nr:hypothetical protein EDC04DRAFT_3144408 [Pisolithus marmoratus]
MQVGNRVFSVAVSQDGRWIVSGENANKVVVWNAATHRKVLEFTEHGHLVLAVDVSSDGTKIASADWFETRIFNSTSGIQFFPPLGHHGTRAVKFSPDGSRFATASYDSGFRVYSTHNGDILFDSGPDGSTSSQSWEAIPLAWPSDGQQLFVAAVGRIICFDVSNFSWSEWSIPETQSPVSIASNGRFIAGSAGSSVSLWDRVSHKQIGSIISHASEIYSIALSPGGAYLACGLKGGKLTIHDLRVMLPQYFYPRLPLVKVSDEVLKSWTQDEPTNTEKLLSEEIASALSPKYYLLANRALIRARLRHVALAVEDAKESLQVQPSPIGYIAMAAALLGQGDREGALCTFDLAFHDCEPHDNRLLLLLKSILVFECGNQEEAITRVEHLVTRANNNDDGTTYVYNQARALRHADTRVLGIMYTRKENYGRAIQLIERAKNLMPKDKQCPVLKTILLVGLLPLLPLDLTPKKIFGWNFNGLDIFAQQRLCETLYTEERTVEAMDILLNIIRTSDEVQESKATADWITDFTKKCATALERVGDETFGFAKHDDEYTEYSAALSLNPSSLTSLLTRRSKARAAKGLWENALQDANDAVKVDPSYHLAYEAKRLALHGTKRYDDAIDAFKSMLHVIEQSHDPAIRHDGFAELRKNYISPSETIANIDRIVDRILKGTPLVVIDVTTGCLCDRPERRRIFKASTMFKELVSSMTRELDNERIGQVVASFFGYSMFSHAWQGTEPSFQEVNLVKSVWNLPDTPLHEKLRNFCKETRRLGHNWAWSDTCCIDKTTSSILNQSLTSMYKWYMDSAVTLVFLAGVKHPSKLGDLTRSLWMTRAWTLQELLAPKVVLFYDCEWKPYLSDTGTNHKESREIIGELADATKTPRGTIITFSPDDLGVREKLRLASTRNVTVEEDVAYSLIGIFKSDIRPHYGEGADALGHLLEEIVARSGEVTVLAWSGMSSSYNSCLPASISVYSQIPYNPPSLEEEEMETCVMELRSKLAQKEALRIYRRINTLPYPRFATRRLHLPCIVFPVKRFGILEQREGNEKVYRAGVLGLGIVEFTTADDLPLHEPQKLVFAHPWIRHIQGPSSRVVWGGDFESDSVSDTDLYFDAASDEVAHPSPLEAVPAPQVDEYTRALQMIVRLGQPFSALLLVQRPNGEYNRVAAEKEIVVPGLGTDITPKNIQATVLEIL